MKNQKLFLLVMLIITLSLSAFAQSKPNIKGTWIEYTPEGKKVTSYKIKIFQINGTTTISIAGQRGEALFTGDKMTVDFMRYWGKVSKDRNRIFWSNKSVWVREKPPAISRKTSSKNNPSSRNSSKNNSSVQSSNGNTRSPRPIAPLRDVPRTGSSSRSRFTPLETRCFNMVQGKVAWNRSGTKTWGPTNIRKLCAGVKDPNALIACFKSKVAKGVTWLAASNYCKANFRTWNRSSSLSSDNSDPARISLTGTWLVYFADGKVGKIPMRITQSGSTFVFDTGIGNQKAKGRISGKTIYVGNNNLKGTVSDDGRVIRLSTKAIWVKR